MIYPAKSQMPFRVSGPGNEERNCFTAGMQGLSHSGYEEQHSELLSREDARFSTQVSSAGEKIAFRVSLDGEEGARLLPQIREVITDFGFKISETVDNEVRMAYESQELNLDNPRQKYIRYHLNITGRFGVQDG